MKKKTARTSSASRLKKTARVVTQAKEQYSEELKSFIVHFILYLLVNFGLFTYFYSNSGDMNLFYWVVAGWGVGLVAHAFAVFGIMKYLHKEW